MSASNGNFGFLAEHDPLFTELALSAERSFASDPNTTLIKLFHKYTINTHRPYFHHL